MQNAQIKDAYEIACLMDSKRLCSYLLASLIRLNSTISSRYSSDDLCNKSQVDRKAIEDLAIELKISICNFEDGLNK